MWTALRWRLTPQPQPGVVVARRRKMRRRLRQRLFHVLRRAVKERAAYSENRGLTRYVSSFILLWYTSNLTPITPLFSMNCGSPVPLLYIFFTVSVICESARPFGETSIALLITERRAITSLSLSASTSMPLRSLTARGPPSSSYK